MLIDFRKNLMNPFSGTIIPLDASGKSSTLSDICVNALLSSFEGESLDGKAKFDMWELARKVNGSEVDLRSEEITLIKERVGKAYSQLIVGIVYEMLGA